MKASIISVPNSQMIARMPLGPLQIASHVTLNTLHHVSVFDLASFLNVYYDGDIGEDIYPLCADLILNHCKSKVIAFSSVVTTEIPMLEISRVIKSKFPDKIIVVGGQWSDHSPEKILSKFDHVDYIVHGEGEVAFGTLLDFLDGNIHFTETHGLSTIQNGTYQNTPKISLIKNLDELAPINFSLLTPKVIDYPLRTDGRRHGIMEFGRGCPYSCSFCSTTFFWGRSVRTYSIDRVISDIQHYINNGLSFIEFTYDNFGTRKNEVKRFCNALIESRLNIKWSARCRLDCLDEETIILLKKANCVALLVGLESGSQDTITNTGKRLNFSKATTILLKLVEHGIRVDTSLITGLSYESESDLAKTMFLAAGLQSFGRSQVDAEIHYVSPLPGTPLTKAAIKNGGLRLNPNPLISPDFGKYLNWSNNPSKYILDSDYNTIKSDINLFSQYYTEINKQVPEKYFAAASSYLDIIVRFFPLTFSSILSNVYSNRVILLVDDMEEYFLSFVDYDFFLSSKVVNRGVSEKNLVTHRTLLRLADEFFKKSSLEHPIEYNIYKYESSLYQLSLNPDDNIKILTLDYDILGKFKKLRNQLVNNCSLDSLDFIKEEYIHLCITKNNGKYRTRLVSGDVYSILMKFLEQGKESAISFMVDKYFLSNNKAKTIFENSILPVTL